MRAGAGSMVRRVADNGARSSLHSSTVGGVGLALRMSEMRMKMIMADLVDTTVIAAAVAVPAVTVALGLGLRLWLRRRRRGRGRGRGPVRRHVRREQRFELEDVVEAHIRLPEQEPAQAEARRVRGARP